MSTKNFLQIVFAIVISFSITSCKKNSLTDTPDVTTSDYASKHATSEALVQNDNDMLMSQDQTFLDGKTFTNQIDYGLPSCVNKTVSGTFPNRTIKLNFGSSCTDAFGIVRSGIMMIQIDSFARQVGGKAIVTFDNYYVNGYRRQGKVTWQCLSRSNDSISWSRIVDTGKITAPDGRIWFHEANKHVTQIGIPASEYVITGSGTVTNIAGNTFSSQIQSALHKPVTCARIVSGTIKYTGTNHYAVIDYGTGDCDNTATISIDGGSPRGITLP